MRFRLQFFRHLVGSAGALLLGIGLLLITDSAFADPGEHNSFWCRNCQNYCSSPPCSGTCANTGTDGCDASCSCKEYGVFFPCGCRL